MKTIIIIILFIILLPYSIFSQWEERNSGTNTFLSGIYFYNDQSGWIVYKDSCIRTTNGGKNWQNIMVSSGGKSLYDVAFVSPEIGIATSSNGRVYLSFNGGLNWAEQNTLTGSENYFGISYIEDVGRHAWIVGTSGKIVYSPNNGSSWTTQVTGSFALNDIYFTNKDSGWAVGNSGTILHTSNGGNSNSWSSQQSNTESDLFGVWFYNSQTGWAVGENGLILNTTDGGQNWHQQNSAVNTNLIKISFYDKTDGVAVGLNGIILHTKDGGNNWLNESGIINTTIYDVHYQSLENCWAIGSNGKILYSNGSIKINSPTGSERFEEGTNQTITWESNYTKNVRIDLSTDNGNTWDKVITNQTSAISGSFNNWNVKNAPSLQCRIRIQSLKDPQVQAISQPFEIYKKTLNLITPTKDTTLIGGKDFIIEWTDTNVTNIKIMFRERPNSPLKAIKDSIPASSLQYQWIVEKVNSEQCRIIISELDGSPIDSSEFFTIKFDENAPRIIKINSNPNPLQKGQPVTITATIEDESGTINKLLYRQGGSSTILYQLMTQVSDSQYQAIIPSVQVNDYGMIISVQSVDKSPDSNRTTSSLEYLDVRIENKTYDISISNPGDNEIYQMISIPYQLEDETISVVLDELGAYNIKKWRLWQWITSEKRYGEFSKDNIEDFSRGNSFWLASTIGPVKSDAGLSYTPTNFSKTLHPGWNQIGHPFAFSVSTDSIYSATGDTTDLTPIYEYNKGWFPVSVLEPGKGYFVKNRADTNKTLTIPPIALTGLTSKLSKVNNITTSNGWEINLKATAKNFTDNYNIIGTYKDASLEWDIRDLPEPPPPVGKYITIYFPHKDWQKYPDNYSTDFRSSITDHEVWDFVVETNIENSGANLNFEDVKNIPNKFQVYLFDRKLKISRDLRKNPTYRFSLEPSPLKKYLMLVIGSEEFIRNNLTVSEVPKDYELNQNFPNPFNPSTTIHYGIPTNSLVTLSIYNILGEEVVTLIRNKFQNTGYHSQLWNGLDKYASQVPSGVYLYRLETASVDGTSNYAEVKKMILLK